MTVQGALLADLTNRIDTVQYSIDPLANFHTTAEPKLQISYSFETSPPSTFDSSTFSGFSGFTGYTGAEKETVRSALHEFEKYINVQFVETNTDDTFYITFMHATSSIAGEFGGLKYV